LEAVKWLAFGAMVIAHAPFAVPMDDEWRAACIEVGKFAFPAFSLCFGIGLASSRDPGAAWRRLLVPALIAQLAWAVLDAERWAEPANMLFSFALCAVAVSCVRDRLWWLAGAAAVIVSLVGEGSVFTVLLTGAGFLAGALRSAWPVFFGGLLWFGIDPSPLVAAAVAAVVLWPSAARVQRVPWLLPWGYAAHLVVYALLARFVEYVR
jgi:hypothetical protein